ncbi:MAG: hypothetical protein M9962_06980 [Oligoflexia bacterium]|nr:hypothetical protein [Oligoflexia bacterium]
MFKFFLGWFLGAFGFLGIALFLGGFWLWGQWQNPTVLPKNWNQPQAYAISSANCYRAFEGLLQVSSTEIKERITVLNEECPILPRSVKIAKEATEAACSMNEKLSCDKAKATLYQKWQMAKTEVGQVQSKSKIFLESVSHLTRSIVEKIKLKLAN